MEKVSTWAATLAPYKLQISVVIIILLLVIYWFYFREEKPKSGSKSGRKGKKGRKQKRKVTKKSHKKSEPDSDSDSEDEDEDDESNAQALYNIAHENLAKGMGQDEFLQLAGELGDPIIYIHLKQLYTIAREDGNDPLNTVTVEDYERVLKNS